MVPDRTFKQHRAEASREEDTLLALLKDEEVLALVIHYLREQSGSLLAQRTGNTNAVPLSAVCQDWRRINRACAADWLTGREKPVTFDWQIQNFSTYLRGCMHNTNILDSPQFLRGAENFRMALGFMDGRQMNSEGAWLPVNECPRSVDAPSHLCVSLTIADKDSYVGTTGQLDVTFTLHHRDSKLSVVRNMRRTFCWGSSGSEYDSITGRQLFRWSHAILNFCPLDTLRGDIAGFMRNDTLSFSVSLAPHRQQPVAATPVSSKRTRPPTRKSACASSSRGETFTDADGRAADEAAAASKSAAVETAQMTKESA